MTLTPVNKSIKFGLKEKKNIFYYFFGLDLAQPVQAGLDLAGPSR
jgi:hypothetical protein